MTETLDLLRAENVEEGEVPRRVPRNLAFVGVSFTWRRRLSDFNYNIDLAEHWEPFLADWSVDDRSVLLTDASTGYHVSLDDGSATFMVNRPDLSLPILVEHIGQFVQSAKAARRLPLRISAEAQFLKAENEATSFEELMRAAATPLLTTSLAERLGGRMEDFAYLADFDVGGFWYQVSIGTLRAREIPMRVVSADYLEQIPALASYSSITSREKVEVETEKDFNPEAFLDRIFRVGLSIF
jgi:hypothetical protein